MFCFLLNNPEDSVHAQKEERKKQRPHAAAKPWFLAPPEADTENGCRKAFSDATHSKSYFFSRNIEAV